MPPGRFCRTCGSPLAADTENTTTAPGTAVAAEGAVAAVMPTSEAAPPKLSTTPPAPHFVYPEGKGPGLQKVATPSAVRAAGGGAAGVGAAAVQGSVMQPPVVMQKSRNTGLVVAVTVAVVLLLGAVTAVTAVVLNKRHDQASSNTSYPSGTSGSGNSGSGGSSSGDAGNSGTGNSGVVTTTTLAANLTAVNIEAVTTSPDIDQIQSTFESYFGGINTRNWGQAYADYSPSYQANTSEQAFESSDTTSTDTNVAIISVTVNPDQSVTADVSFTSNQAAAYGQDGETCTDWTLAYQLVSSNGAAGTSGYVIEAALGVGPGAVACPAS